MNRMKNHGEDMSKVCRAEINKRKELEDVNRQLMAYAEALNRTLSEVKSKNELLGALALELSGIEERERAKIAEDLHDHVGQTLAMAKVKLQELGKSGANIDAARLDEIDGLINQAISYSRSMIFEISPNALLELGFIEAIEWLVEHIHNKHGLDIKYSHCEQTGPMDGNTGIVLFKAVRELLMNIVKHARTDKAEVTVANDGDCVRATVSDKGCGFDPADLNASGKGRIRFGLFNLQQRIINAGGAVEIDSSAGRGTRVSIAMPKKIPTEKEQT